ncbi:type I polyketide synthase [Corallococcus sicarius]|uniref:SDR family NAD(P)-dependent oxidoreductase n=1 Tax=Corallococcus sicarius TaxID=2316726 RepID=A0A3A8N240_9BACT|nr:type I polyketide synthase [Corallococcus sicarius]RKH37599.1 SDR family NAD(P)-dependent oxidoreductase [Corallococcus sicarius]
MSDAQPARHEGIAIIGMAGRFPGAPDLETFWRNLLHGVEARTVLTDEELEAAGVARELRAEPHYVRSGFFLDGVELFDAGFFGLTPREAELLDPQQRFFLECAWEALERAGYADARDALSIGVFAGASASSYLLSNLLSRPELIRAVGAQALTLANDKDYLATRASYLLDLKGPSLTVQTACSTSLVAVHLACQALLNGELDVALAGGVSIPVPHRVGYLPQPGSIASPDGHCRAFDAEAQGTVAGSGVGLVVLKPLERALEDGDTVLAVIRASALNNDGASKVGFTAPSVEGQAAVITEALGVSGLTPADIQYVEAHGTGTALGDPIELSALNQAFQQRPASAGACALGSLKPNIGHLDAAAGVAGLMKTVLALQHGKLPPSLHFKRPGPLADFGRGPFQVVTEARDWAPHGVPRRAGVSSFGMGGTNAHVVLEQAPQAQRTGDTRPWHVLMLSARTEQALEAATDGLAAWLERDPDVALADVAHTLHAGRRRFEHRRILVCQGVEDARQGLTSRDARRLLTLESRSGDSPVVFLFPGQGAQHAGMGQGLYASEPVFRKHVDRCCELLQPVLGLDLREVLYPPEGLQEQAHERLRDTALAQPALFVTSYALARLWMSLGVRPRAMLGHSVGEYVAACLADVLSLEDALALVAARGQLMRALPGGAMLSVALGEEALRPLLGSGLSLAAVNAPSLCVASGPLPEVEALEARLRERGVEHRRLHTSHAFHSVMMAPILDAFEARVRQTRLSPPKLPYLSNVTGAWVTAEQATDPRYWVEHLRQPVRFADALGALLQEPERVFLEVGPGQTLTLLARQAGPLAVGRAMLTSMRRPQDTTPDLAVLLEAAGRLWMVGVQLKAQRLHGSTRRVPLPTYPFQRQRYWIDAGTPAAALPSGGVPARKDAADWFYRPVWKRALPPAAPATSEPGRWLVLLDDAELGARLAAHLVNQGEDVVTVSPGDGFHRQGERQYTLDVRQPEQHATLLSALQADGGVPRRIVHLAGLGRDTDGLAGFHGLLFLARALLAHEAQGPFELNVLTRGAQDVTGGEPLEPGQATALGPCKVLPQEEPCLRCRTIDVVPPEFGGPEEERLVARLADELRAPVDGMAVAYRSGQRWRESFEPVRLPAPQGRPALLRERGVYLITGGLGRIGLAQAEVLFQQARARLVLVGRTAMPERSDWEDYVRAHDAQDGIRQTLERLLKLEQRGAEVLLVRADVARREQLEAAVAGALARFGELHGVIHSAGSVGGETFLLAREATPARCEEQFQAKVHGTRALHDALRDLSLDFVLLQSSLSSVLGGLGFSAYAAANAFLDAFAAARSRTGGTPWLSVNWPGWHTAEGAPTEHALAFSEGLEAFLRLLDAPASARWALCTTDLPTQAARWLQAAALPTPKKVGARHPRPALATRYVAPRDDVEQALAACWEELLGIEGLGVEDDFFELGGHSLLGTQVLSRVRELYRVDLSLRGLFESPTIAALALSIVKHKAASADAQALEALLAELE